MRLSRFEIHTINIPMRIKVQHTLADRSEACNIVVAAYTDQGQSGWGESCPRAYVTGETIDSVKTDLTETILPKLLGQEFTSFDEVVAMLTGLLDGIKRNQQAAFCAAELALLDLAGNFFEVCVGQLLGPAQTDQARYSGVIAATDLKVVENMAVMIRHAGVSQVKIKTAVDLDSNRNLLAMVRKILGNKVSLRIDANCAWSGEEAVHQLQALAEFNLAGVEQPVPRNDLAGLKTVTAAKLVPVVVDESLCSLADADRLIREQACDVFNLRVSKCGGLINTGRIYQRAQAAGLDCQLGAQVGEMGFLSAAGRHVATRCAGLLWCEGSYGELLLQEDVVTPDITLGLAGFAPALDGPGLGVRPLTERLAKYRLELISVTA